MKEGWSAVLPLLPLLKMSAQEIAAQWMSVSARWTTSQKSNHPRHGGVCLNRRNFQLTRAQQMSMSAPHHPRHGGVYLIKRNSQLTRAPQMSRSAQEIAAQWMSVSAGRKTSHKPHHPHHGGVYLNRKNFQQAGAPKKPMSAPNQEESQQTSTKPH